MRSYFCRQASEVSRPSTKAPQSGPAERRGVALRNYDHRAGRIVSAGSGWDANDDFVKANPDMFGPEAA